MAQSGECTSGRLPALRVLNPEADEVLRNGENRLIGWELEVPPAMTGYLTRVDITLRNEDTDFTPEIADTVSTGNTTGQFLRDRYRWRVDSDPGRYAIRIHLSRNLQEISDRSRVFRIE